ncbi:MAG: hypothetical protein SFV21_00225 [Rhodospirillaceae bacterium]|nr:hypothetical protein [Rhodospirillaceae bacterium]
MPRRYVELHPFADDRFVANGFTHFAWSTFDAAAEPAYAPGFGFALDVSGLGYDPSRFARYNPAINTWAAALPDDAVPALQPFHAAQWNGTRWIIGGAS